VIGVYAANGKSDTHTHTYTRVTQIKGHRDFRLVDVIRLPLE